MNLGFLDVLSSRFGFPVGLSDHTEGSLAAAVAVAKSVQWIEKHITMDRNAAGFDHAYAMEPVAFAQYVRDVRSVEAACAGVEEKIGEAEMSVKQRARRGIYARRDLEVGKIISQEDVLIVRPEGQLSPNDLPLILGKRMNKRARKFQALSAEFVS